jgi:transposase InsO family protein
MRLRPEQRNHVWSYDFVEDRTHDGRKYRMLNVLDEFTHECLAIRVARKLKAIDVIDVLSDLFILRGIPGHIRSDNGPEFVAEAVQEWIAAVGTKTAYIERGSPWENGYSKASMLAFAMSCSTARSSTVCARLESSSRAGDATTTRPGPTRHLDSNHQRRRCSCPPSPRGRLRYPEPLRRPRWRNGQP